MNDRQSVWRLIPLLRSSGGIQMALDTWLLEQHRLGLHPPTLRFYTWSPPAISLGYHQQRWLPHWQQLTWQGQPVELVRRPTGGRAVLHQGDLTYGVILSKVGNRIEVYQEICEFLIQGWRSLGLELHYGGANRSYAGSANCFETATSADLVTPTGAKFIGSAQLRRRNAILQHGSMRLNPDTDLFSQVFGTACDPVELPLQQQGEALIDLVVEALTVAASRCFGVQLVAQPLSEAEWQAVLKIDRSPLKYQVVPGVDE